MKNLQTLLDAYRQDSRTSNIVQELKNDSPARVKLLELVGAQLAFVIEGVYQQYPANHLIVADNKEEAAYWQNDLAALFGKRPVHFFPDSFKQPLRFEELNQTNVLERTEVINAVSNASRGQIIVTYPEALFERVVAPEVLSKTRIEIAKGEKLDPEFLIQVLVEYKFTREEFVFEPGQFSLRGGIIDIFSFGNDLPYRVELFDDEVESIRTFNPLSQLSAQNISKVSIVPNINTRFKQEDKVSLFRVLKEDTVIWLRDFQVLIDRLQRCFEDAEKFAKTISILDETELAEVFRDRAFLYPGDVVEDVRQHPIVLLSNAPQPLTSTAEIKYGGKPQPSFNRNFDLLIENLHANSAAGWTNYLFTENPKQVERFYTIFEDLRAKVEFFPIVQGLHQGFVDPLLNVACYTDHQVFERFHRYKLRQGYSKEQALNLRLLRDLQPGDFVTHIDHGIGQFKGLQTINVNGHVQECVRLVYKNNDLLYVSINSLHKIAKYVGKEGTPPQLNKLGSDAWRNLKAKTKKKVKGHCGRVDQTLRPAQGHARFCLCPRQLHAGGAGILLHLRGYARPVAGHHRYQERHDQTLPDGSPDLWRRGFWQNGGGHPGGVQGDFGWQTGGRAGADHHPRPATRQNLWRSPQGVFGYGGLRQPLPHGGGEKTNF